MPKAGAARRAEAQWIPVNATTLELTKEENEGKTFEVRAGHVPTFMPSSTEEMNAKFATVYSEPYTFSFNTTVTSVYEIETDGDAPAEYFNLQGMRIERPTSGLVIRRCGNRVEKIRL